jgi:hypothetical protein
MAKKSVPTPVREIMATKGALEVADTLGVHVPTTIPTMGKAACSWICGKLSSFWGWCFCSSAVASYALGLAIFVVAGAVILQIASGLA